MEGTASQRAGLTPDAATRLHAALAAVPAVAALPEPAATGLLRAIEGACGAFLADRVVAPGTRSAEVADRLGRAATAARTLTAAVEALDGVGWGLVGRQLRGVAGSGAGEPPPPADIQSLLACVHRVHTALGESADLARQEPQVGVERARLRLAAGVGMALDRVGIPLGLAPEDAFAGCVEAALVAVGLAPPAEFTLLLERAAKVARREQGRSARA